MSDSKLFDLKEDDYGGSSFEDGQKLGIRQPSRFPNTDIAKK